MIVALVRRDTACERTGEARGTFLGTFNLTSAGELFFYGAAIPEPSTYAALLGTVTLGIVAIRRRRQAETAIEV